MSARHLLGHGVRAMHDAISRAADLADPQLATEELTAILKSIDDQRAHCLARLRLRLPVDPRRRRGGAEAVQCAERLITEVVQHTGKPPSIEDATLGRLRVRWLHGTTWIVAPIDIPWPGVDVRVYTHDTIETLYLAESVIELTIRAERQSASAVATEPEGRPIGPRRAPAPVPQHPLHCGDFVGLEVWVLRHRLEKLRETLTAAQSHLTADRPAKASTVLSEAILVLRSLGVES